MEQDELRNLLIREMEAVYRLAYHLAPRRHEVDDLVQETYLRAFKGLGKFQLTEFGPRPWLFKILHNLIASRYVAYHREPGSDAGLENEPSPRSPAADDAFADVAHLNWDGIDERLKQAIEALPLASRSVFLLSAVEGLKYREIAEVMAVPVGTVMSRLFRARADLASRLSDLARESGWIKPARDTGDAHLGHAGPGAEALSPDGRVGSSGRAERSGKSPSE